MYKDTIVAIATPPGRGGIGIIRLSGSDSYAIALELNGHKPLAPRIVNYCTFSNDTAEIIDNGLAIFFKSPNSFTGEDVIELQVHGSPIALDCLITRCIKLGARLALPGEFSERAFLNEKIDLTQAEAIADLINASSQTAARLAANSLQGNFSRIINAINEKIINLRIWIEATIDFPEDEVNFIGNDYISTALNKIFQEMQATRTDTYQGSILREGLSIVITGQPNVGKSTLMNALSGRNIAIVTEIAGTTRDIIRECILVDDIPINLIDSAGLHNSNDVVELEGIKRAWHEIDHADCILVVLDINYMEPGLALGELICHKLGSTVPIIHVINKIDSVGISPRIQDNNIYISAKLNNGMDLLKNKIKEIVGYQPAEGKFLARRRHLDALDRAISLLVESQMQWQQHKATELLAEDLRLVHQTLGEITGRFTTDNLLEKIFLSFCIGK